MTTTNSLSITKSTRVALSPSPDPTFIGIFPNFDRPETGGGQQQLPLESEARIIPIRRAPSVPIVDVPLSEAELDEAEFSRQPTRRESLPEPSAWVEKFVQGAFEVMAGRRNGAQFARWTNRAVYFHLQHRNGLIDEAPHIHRVHICEPADGIAEATVTVRVGSRLRAAALRFEGLDGRWICTSMMLC
ncbi:MAG TPA: Rv3235 family protein [Candidatus Nanopelagicaceae bacterium]|nr:Rv3235 family protein [Candidatus Nanopelagicaceae bacterium]